MTISQSNPRPQWFRWRENRPIILYEALHVRQEKPNRFIEVANFFKYMKCDRRIQQANCLYVSHSVSAYTVCVCLSVCLAVTGEFPDSTDPDEWVTVCPHVCVSVYVWSTVTFAHSFPHQCKIFSPWKYWSFLSSLHHPTNTHNVLSAGCHTITISTSHVNCVIHRSLLFYLPRLSCHAMDHFWPRTSSTMGPFGDSHPPTSGNLLSLQTRDHD